MDARFNQAAIERVFERTAWPFSLPPSQRPEPTEKDKKA